MSENAPVVNASQPAQTQAAPVEPLLGHPASEARWMVPVAIYLLLFAVSMMIFVMLPLQRSARAEPSPAVRAVMSDQVFLLHFRVWPLLVMSAFFAAAAAVLGSRRIGRAHNKLEMRLRRVAGGEMDESAFRPSEEFAQFEEPIIGLRYAIERSAKRNRGILQQVQSPIKRLSDRLAAEEVPRIEVRKALAEILTAIDSALDADRRFGGGRKP